MPRPYVSFSGFMINIFRSIFSFFSKMGTEGLLTFIFLIRTSGEILFDSAGGIFTTSGNS